ncbi:MAG: InlB B-repeat-containing protein [Spirochaetes bacterium]|nr:InlB B-repeat-containing protein [Spirochaetota bacterium]
MKTRNYIAAALLALFFGLFGCFEDSAFDSIGGSLTRIGLPIGNLLIAPTYNVIYDGNESTGGTVPVDDNEYPAGSLVTVLGNTGDLEKTLNVFVGWNTQQDGEGVTYFPGNLLAMGTDDVILYAKWTAQPTYTVTYDANGGSGDVPVDSNFYLEDDEVTVKANTGSLTLTGYVFAGWDKSGTTYNPGEIFTMGTADVTLSAIWSDQWAQDAYLKASNAEASDYFGRSVAVDGSTIVVGAYGEDCDETSIDNADGDPEPADSNNNNDALYSGAAYVFKTAAGNWYQDAYLKASNAEESDNFGYSVAVSGSIIAVGADGEASNQTTITNADGSASTNNKADSSGAVYVFKRTLTKPRVYEWVQDAYLKPSNTGEDDSFGTSVAVDGLTIAVGADGEDSSQTTITNTNGSASTDNGAYSSGAVYVFKLSTKTLYWYQDAYLKASNAEAYDYFGDSVAVSGDTIVVGAYGEDSSQTGITNDDGSASSNNTALYSGAVYVFKNVSGTWVQDAYLKASNAEAYDRFGYSVAVDGDTIVVGAYGEDCGETSIDNQDGDPEPTDSNNNNDSSSSGAAYVFKKVSGTWVQDAYLKASNADEDDHFGYSVGVSGNFIVVGAYYEESSQATITNTDGSASGNNDYLDDYPGAAYVFKKNASDYWVQDAYLKASNVDAFDRFGYSVGVSGYTIVVGAYNEDSNQVIIDNTDGSASADNSASNSGAAYVFTLK